MTFFTRLFAKTSAKTISRSVPNASNERLIQHCHLLWDALGAIQDLDAKAQMYDTLMDVRDELQKRGVQHPIMEELSPLTDWRTTTSASL